MSENCSNTLTAQQALHSMNLTENSSFKNSMAPRVYKQSNRSYQYKPKFDLLTYLHTQHCLKYKAYMTDNWGLTSKKVKQKPLPRTPVQKKKTTHKRYMCFSLQSVSQIFRHKIHIYCITR